jgi:hypothetical protein
MILNTAAENKYNYLFIGFHGRKGPKLYILYYFRDNTIMGTTV